MNILKKKYFYMLLSAIVILVCSGCQPEFEIQYSRAFFVDNLCAHDIYYSVKLRSENSMNENLASENMTAQFTLVNTPRPKPNGPLKLGEVSERLLPTRTADSFGFPPQEQYTQMLKMLIAQKNPPFVFSEGAEVVIKHDDEKQSVQRFNNVELQKMERYYAHGYLDERYILIEICPRNVDKPGLKPMQRSTVPY